MSTRCALCGAGDPTRKVYPPGEWVAYLQSERSLSTLEGVLAVPLCTGCHDRVGPLRDAFRCAGELSGADRETLHRRVEATLEDIDLDAVIDETEGSQRDVGGLL